MNVQREGMGNPDPRQTPLQLACHNRAEQDWQDALRSLRAGHGRVGQGAFAPRPLTEPDLWATHPALWVPFSQVEQQRLTRGQFAAAHDFRTAGRAG